MSVGSYRGRSSMDWRLQFHTGDHSAVTEPIKEVSGVDRALDAAGRTAVGGHPAQDSTTRHDAVLQPSFELHLARNQFPSIQLFNSVTQIPATAWLLRINSDCNPFRLRGRTPANLSNSGRHWHIVLLARWTPSKRQLIMAMPSKLSRLI